MISSDPDLSGDLKIELEAFDLSPLSATDIPDVLDEFSDPRVVEWMDIEPLKFFDEAAAIIAWAENQRALGAGLRWSIRRRSDGAFAGTCGFNRLVLERGRRGEIAYDLCHRWQGRGVMGEVLPAVIAFGWRRLDLYRLEALVTPGNDRSCRLLERHGFGREGMLADFGYWKGRLWDQIVFGLTRQGRDATL